MQTPSIRLHVFSDYICPFCYIGHGRLQRLREEFELDINWCHVELSPRLPQGARGADICRDMRERWLRLSRHVQRLRREDGLEFCLPLQQAQSRKALLLSEYAKPLGGGLFERLQQGIFDAYFQGNADIGDELLLQQLARAAGLSEVQIREAWRDGLYPDRLQQHIFLARQLGVDAAPTYVIGDRVLVGVQSLAALREAFWAYRQQEVMQGVSIH